jgi:Icc-related predicted phosphoesterase
VRILHCTDFHGHQPWYDWLSAECARYDLICLTGDLLDLFSRTSPAEQIARITGNLRAIMTPLAICSGNHDDLGGTEGTRWLGKLRRRQLWVDGDQFECKGRTFRCVGWKQPLPAAARDEIWLIHAPPDDCATSNARREINHGDFALGELCRGGQGPWIALSGHIHAPLNWWARVGETWSFNPGLSQATAQPNVTVIDLERNVAFAIHHTALGKQVREPLRLNRGG